MCVQFLDGKTSDMVFP